MAARLILRQGLILMGARIIFAIFYLSGHACCHHTSANTTPRINQKGTEMRRAGVLVCEIYLLD